jgi:hypothetical protein
VLKMLHTGLQWYCDLCQAPLVDITEARGIFRPLEGPDDAADVLVAHRACAKEGSLLRMLLPARSSRPLAELLAQADEALNR